MCGERGIVLDHKTGAARNILLHMAAIFLLFLFTDAFKDAIYGFVLRMGFTGGWAMAVYAGLDLLHVWIAAALYAHYLLGMSAWKRPLGRHSCAPAWKRPLGRHVIPARWYLAAVLLPAAVDGFYLVFTDGTLQSGGLPQREQAVLFFQHIFVYGIRDAAICGWMFRGLAMEAFTKAFRISLSELTEQSVQKMCILLSAFFYAAVSVAVQLPSLWCFRRAFLLFLSRFLFGAALAACTCASGSILPSVIIDACYNAFCGNGQILHIGTEQALPAVYTYTLKTNHWAVAGLSGNCYLETAVPSTAGFFILTIFAWRQAGRQQWKSRMNIPNKNKRLTSAFADSLTGTMVKRLLGGLFAGSYLACLLYFGGRAMLHQHFLAYGTKESAFAEALQAYAASHHIAAVDAKAISHWAKGKELSQLLVARDGWLLYDAAYPGELLHSSKKMPVHGWRPYYHVLFADGDTDVYVSTGFDQAYDLALLAGAAVCGFGACLWIVWTGMLKTVSDIQYLEREADAIRRGELQRSITAKGNDELCQLARGMDQMRRQLLERMETQQQMRTAQEKLVLGMSHDLRTPLSGLFTYMDVIKKREQDGLPIQEYIDKAYDKVQQIKHLSDQMFEYFLIHSRKKAALEPAEEISSALGDYLSELCALLECSGFSVNGALLEWKPVYIQVDTDYLGRIMDNLYSNLDKYADRDGEVRMRIVYEQNRAGAVIENRIALPGQYVEGTGIGVKNIMLMMEQMQGSVQVEMVRDHYCITLYFPLVL